MFEVRNIVQIGILSAIAFLLMSLEFPLWFAPGFYKLDLSELPVLIGAFAMGPLAGVMTEFIKILAVFLPSRQFHRWRRRSCQFYLRLLPCCACRANLSAQ